MDEHKVELFRALEVAEIESRVQHTSELSTSSSSSD